MKPEVTAETNLNGKKARKSPVPQDAARITMGALKLSIEEMVLLRDDLTACVNKKLKEMEAEKIFAELKYNEAKKLIGG